jgi:hypothetical protein
MHEWGDDACITVAEYACQAPTIRSAFDWKTMNRLRVALTIQIRNGIDDAEVISSRKKGIRAPFLGARDG